MSLVIFTYLAKSYLILKNQHVKKLFSLGYIYRYEFSFIRIILINWWKLTFLYRLFSKFRENVNWPMKAKSAISAKIFFRKTLYGLCIEIDKIVYFWRRHNRFHKNNYMKKAPEVNRFFVIYKISYDRVLRLMKNSYRDMRHYVNTMLLLKYYEYVSTKFFKIAM